MNEKTDGRDHNPYGFSMAFAGGGVKAGMTHGATDEFGLRAIEDRVHVHDLHATMLHLFGLDHKRLTFPRWSRRTPHHQRRPGHSRNPGVMTDVARHQSSHVS